MAEIRIPARIDTRKALNDIRSFARSSRSIINSISDSFFSLKTLAAGAVAFLGGRQIIRGIASVTEAASRQEDAVNSLNTALALSGEFSQEASKDMQDFASSLQAVTKFGDEAILEQLALAKAFGATNEQAKQVTQAAIELAAATGKSLEEATRQVSKTLGGFAGELGEVNPAIKALTKEQLQAGEAARVLIQQFGGSAAAQVNTFSGAIAQASNTFGDLQEAIGSTITQNPVVIGAIKLLNEVFKDLIQLVTRNKDSISGFIGDAIKSVISSLPSAIRSIGFLSDAIEGAVLAFNTIKIVVADAILTLLKIDSVRIVIGSLVDVSKTFGVLIAGQFNLIFKSLSLLLGLAAKIPGTVGVAFNEAKEAVDGFDDSVSKIRDSLIAGIGEGPKQLNDVKDALVDSRDAALDFGDKVIDRFSGTRKSINDVAKEVEELSKSIQNIKGTSVEIKVNQNFDDIEDLFSFGVVLDFILNPIGTAADLIESAGKTFAMNAGEAFKGFSSILTASLVGGAEGAQKLLVEGGAAAIDAFAPGFGQAAKPLLDAFSKGPEFVEKQVDEFVKALPQLLENIAEAAPAFVRALADNADEIIIALVEAAPDLAAAIAVEVPLALSDPAIWERVALALWRAVVDAVSFRMGELNAQLNQFGANLAQTLNNVVSFFQNDIPREVSAAFSGGIKNAFSDLDLSNEIDFSAFEDSFVESARIFGDSLVDEATRFIDKLIEEINGAVESVTPGGDFFRDPVGSTTRAVRDPGGTLQREAERIGLANGGVVPAGFPNDTFRANLTSGEQVATGKDRTDFAGAVETNTAMLAQLMAAFQQFASQNVTINLNQQALSNSILELNRRNARLTS